MKKHKKVYDPYYTTRIKWYPSKHGTFKPAQIMVFDRPVFNPFSIEEEQTEVCSDDLPEVEKDSIISEEQNKARSLRRAKNAIKDIVLCNDDLDLFVTVTFDKNCIDRYSYEVIIKKLKIWLSNRSQRYGLKYLLIPEYHKDRAIHFHGFFNASACDLVDSNHKTKDGKTIFNIVNFPFGFSTAISIPDSSLDRAKVSSYILKYVTKGTEKVGGRYYLHGGKLLTPTYTFDNNIIDDQLCSAVPYSFSPFSGCSCAVYDTTKLPDDEKTALYYMHFTRRVENKNDLTV